MISSLLNEFKKIISCLVKKKKNSSIYKAKKKKKKISIWTLLNNIFKPQEAYFVKRLSLT